MTHYLDREEFIFTPNQIEDHEVKDMLLQLADYFELDILRVTKFHGPNELKVRARAQ